MSLSRSRSLRAAAVLEDCSDRLYLVGHTLRVQMSRERGAAAAAQERAWLEKLKCDCDYVSQQVKQLQSELEEKQSFNLLLDVAERERLKEEEAQKAREKKQQWTQKKEALEKRKEEMKQKSEHLKDLEKEVRHLKYSLQKQSEENVISKKSLEYNLKVYLQLLQEDTSKMEKKLEEHLELQQEQLQDGKEIHAKSMILLQAHYEELQQQMQHWKQLSTRMIKEKEDQLNGMSCKKTWTWDELSDMRRKFRQMEKVVLEDREGQEKLHQQQELARAATKLQAWWRGCMVRRGLGRFKRKDERKKVKQNKKAKKKKKK